ncbi:BC_2427 family protein [Paenibacillus sp. 102]|uniref:BC_2427 family protein n=1 Tax=Paenibacillus sp. 102 TaxID=3120823 RepID=UPI0031BB6169
MSNPWISNKVVDELFSKHKKTLKSKKKHKLIEENVKEDRTSEEYKEADKLIEENVKEDRTFEEHKEADKLIAEGVKEEKLSEEHKEVNKSPNELKIGSAGRSITVKKAFSTGAEVSNFLNLPIITTNPWISNKMVDKLFTKHKKILKKKEADKSIEESAEEDSSTEGSKEADKSIEESVKEDSSTEGGKEADKSIEESVEEDSSTEGSKEADNSAAELEIGSTARSIIVKTPFSTVAEVSDFLNLPILSSKDEEVFIFQNETEKMLNELEAKMLATVHHYHEEPYCYFVSSKLFENRVFLELANVEDIRNSEDSYIKQSFWTPMHNVLLKEKIDDISNNYITTRLPIEIGKYKTEIGLKEKVIFQEKVAGIKEISQEVILTDSKFFSPEAKNVKRNPVTVEKGILLVDGYILQRIEYIVACSNEKNLSQKKVYQLLQKIVLELIVQILQEQEVKVEIM